MDIRLQEIANGAAGTYFLVYDNSQKASIPTNTTLRCVMINTKKGPVNNLVYISRGDSEGFKKIFGEIDRRDERNGNFSIRTALWLLENGPIVVCNLRSFDDEKDLAGVVGLSTKFGTVNEVINLTSYKNLFNTDRLWYNDPKRLLTMENKSILNIGNIGSSDVSVFIRKSRIMGYDATIREWYTSLNLDIPTFVNPNDKVSDTMVDVFVFNTNFGEPMKNMTNENYGHLFNESGLKPYSEYNGNMVDSLELLKQISDSQYVGNWTGSLIPGFVNQSGQPLQIEQIMNSVSGVTGLSFKLDESAMELIGDWVATEDTPINVTEAFSSTNRKPFAIDLVGHAYTKEESGTITFNGIDSILSHKFGNVLVGEAKIDNPETPWDIDVTEAYNTDITKIPILLDANTAATGNATEFYIFDAVSINPGDYIVGEDGNLIKVLDTTLINSQPITATEIDGDIIDVPVEHNLIKVKVNGVPFHKFDTVLDSLPVTVTENGDNITNLVTYDHVWKIKPLTEFKNSVLEAIVLPSYKPRANQFTNGTATQQSRILDVMNLPNMVKGFKNAQNLRFRYIVDAFKTFIEPSYKNQYSRLVQELSEKSTMFCRAILNEAFIEDMGSSINPYFKNSPSGSLETKFIMEGGNKLLPNSNRYTKPKDGDVYSFFFGPGVRVNHQGTETLAPIAGLVGKAFLDKYTNRFPYTITANNSGVINGANVIGIETDFDQDDRKYLEHVGYNAVISDDRRGLLIFGNNTAQTHIKTDLSKIHVSELVAFIQEQMLAIMKDYLFEWNDYQNRLEIRKRADAVMLQILSNRGIYWFENICDGSNNTQDVIDNDMGVIDTRIVAAHGGEKWVHRTFLEKGANIVGFEIV